MGTTGDRYACPGAHARRPIVRRSIESLRGSRSGPESVLVQEDNGDSGHNEQSAPHGNRPAPGKLQMSVRVTALAADGAPVASDRDGFGMRDPRAVLAGEQASMLRQPVVIEHGLHPLLPLATLVNERVTRPHAPSRADQAMLGRDPAIRQPAGHQQLSQMPGVRQVVLGALFVPPQRAPSEPPPRDEPRHRPDAAPRPRTATWLSPLTPPRAPGHGTPPRTSACPRGPPARSDDAKPRPSRYRPNRP